MKQDSVTINQGEHISLDNFITFSEINEILNKTLKRKKEFSTDLVTIINLIETSGRGWLLGPAPNMSS